MNIDKLYKACERFEKLAQGIPKVPSSENFKFWSGLLLHAIQSYAQMLSTPLLARKLFEACVAYHKSPALADSSVLKSLSQIEGAITEGAQRLRALGKDPIDVLTKMGMSNLNSNSLNIMLENLKILKEGVDFSKYRHYYLPAHGENKETIELDNLGPGY